MQLELGDITVDVVQKDIKNVHLSVYPPTGQVRISAPLHMEPDTLRLFAISKLGWIKQEQRKLREQPRETPREYLERESHYLWGERYLLEVIEVDAPPKVEVEHSKLRLSVHPGSGEGKKQAVLNYWYREQLKAVIPDYITKWEPILNVQVEKFFVQQMKTKWGSCSPQAKSIRLNTELAKKPPECLEYIVVHEMMHLLEPTHNSRFVALMDRFMPQWTHVRDELNSLPVRHESWLY